MRAWRKAGLIPAEGEITRRMRQFICRSSCTGRMQATAQQHPLTMNEQDPLTITISINPSVMADAV